MPSSDADLEKKVQRLEERIRNLEAIMKLEVLGYGNTGTLSGTVKVTVK